VLPNVPDSGEYRKGLRVMNIDILQKNADWLVPAKRMAANIRLRGFEYVMKMAAGT